jgi:salicylate hydroxylase
MLPSMAQGAAQALEDGVSLTTCLSKMGDVAAAFAQYEKLRLPRTSRMQAMSAANKTRFHLPDGPAQQERDAKMAAGTTDWSIKAIAWVFNYDAAAAVETGDLGLPADM